MRRWAWSAAACTGASYLAGREREAEVTREIAERHKHPFITAALAVVDALTVLKAKRIGLVSPYPDDLNKASVAYWQSHGFEVAEVATVFNEGSAFHPIYSLGGSSASQALQSLGTSRSMRSSCSAPACRRCGRSPTRSAGRARR